MAPDVVSKVKVEIERLLKAKFIRTIRYVTWLSNIFLVIKKNGKLQVCINFRNLNNATFKDEHPMPTFDILVDLDSRNAILTFMDGYSNYNQIFITKEDVTKTTFRSLGFLRTYEWVIMPIRLKNAKPKYQRAMNLGL